MPFISNQHGSIFIPADSQNTVVVDHFQNYVRKEEDDFFSRPPADGDGKVKIEWNSHDLTEMLDGGMKFVFINKDGIVAELIRFKEENMFFKRAF